MIPVVEAAKAEFCRARDRLKRGLKTTPDDKVNWSPSATSRSPLNQVAHAAFSINGMIDWLKGKPFEFDSLQALDDACLAEEKSVTTREQAIALLDENCDKYLAWLDSLTPEQVAGSFTTPFGTFPMSEAITFAADHTRGHAAQLEYIQTIYGDRIWHFDD